MTAQEAEQLADQVKALAIRADDNTVLGRNVASLIRECASEILAETEWAEEDEADVRAAKDQR